MIEENHITQYTLMLLLGLQLLILGLAGIIMGGVLILIGIIFLTSEYYYIKKNATILDWKDQIKQHIILSALWFVLILILSLTIKTFLLIIYLCAPFLISELFFLCLGIRDNKRQPEIAQKRMIRGSERYEKHIKEIHTDFGRIKEIPSIIENKELELEKAWNEDNRFELSIEKRTKLLKEIKSLNKELKSLKKKHKLKFSSSLKL
ncbi:MAG: hypothetical protein ACFFG0_11605 [Candidatus Thorarchaeota archaeon]